MIFIIGAGVSGLSVAGNLNGDFRLIEKNSYPGGLSTQYRSGKHWFDHSGHYFHFSGKSEVKEYLEKFSKFREYKRDSRVHMFGKFIPFPVQYHLSHFPEDVSCKVLHEIRNRQDDAAENLEDSLKNNFGETLYQLFFLPFMTKYYRRPLSGMIHSMDRGSIPVPDMKKVEEGYRGGDFSDSGYNPVFYYPAPGLRPFISSMEERIRGKITYNEEVAGIDLKNRIIATGSGTHQYTDLVNTMPLKRFAEIAGLYAEFGIGRESFESVSTLVVNLVLKEKRRDFHWVYLPEDHTDYYRAGYYPAHPETACYLERSLVAGTTEDPHRVRTSAVRLLKDLGMILSDSEVLHMDIKRIPDSYIIFNREWPDLVPKLLGFLKRHHVHSIGRYGSWNYTSMSDDIKTGIETARELNRRK